MRHWSAMTVLSFCLVMGWASAVSAQTCDQTLSSGNDVDSAYAAVANGVTWTICLNNGTYSGSAVAFANETRTSGYVTIRSVNALGATLSGVSANNVDYLRFQGVRMSTVTVNGCSTHVEFIDTPFVEDAPGLFFNEDNESGCQAQNNLVDGATFANVDLNGFEGRLSTRTGVNGLTVINSFFGSNGYGDGIQIGGGTNIVIGPGNIFDGISQAFCNANGGAHCDAIQIFCGLSGWNGCSPLTNSIIIKQNLFKNSETMIMAPDGSLNVTAENNVFDYTGTSYSQPIQFGTAVNPIFRHNTIKGTVGFSANFDSKPGNPASSNVLAENNIMHGTQWVTEGGNGCTNCTFRYNLYSVSGYAQGTNNVIGTPDYIGGTTPTTWAGWQLDTGSPGENAGNDGLDMGTTFYGEEAPAGGAPVLRLRIAGAEWDLLLGLLGGPLVYLLRREVWRGYARLLDRRR